MIQQNNSAFLHNSDPSTSMNTGCSPVIHISEMAEDSKSPDDMRFHEWQNPSKEQPTTRLDSPHQTQFAYRSSTNVEDVVQKEDVFHSRGARPKANYNAVPGVFPVESWSDSFDGNRLFGPSPAIPKTAFGSDSFDVDMSDQSGQNNSTGLTPGSSASYNHSGSNTSYTPPELLTEESTNSQTVNMPSIAGKYNGYTSFAPPTNNMFAAQRSDSGSGRSDGNVNVNSNNNPNGHFQGNGNSTLQDNDPFKLASGWDQPLGNMTSPASLTGMTPEGGWANWEG